MRLAPVLAFVFAACADTPVTDPLELADLVSSLPDEQASAPFRVTLTSTPFLPGQSATLTASGLPNGAQVYFLKSEAGPGAGPCHPSFPATCAGVRAPLAVIGTAAAAGGTAATFYNVPAGAVAPQWLQAFVAIPATGRSSTSAVLVRVPGDTDLDYVVDATDNCPAEANADQLDADLDNVGEVCDCDDTNAAIGHGTPEVPGNLLDEDCDGVALDPWVGPWSGLVTSEVQLLFFPTSCDGDIVFDVDPGQPAVVTGTLSCVGGFPNATHDFDVSGTIAAGLATGVLAGPDGFATWSGAPVELPNGLRQLSAAFSGDLGGSFWEGSFDAFAP